MATIIAYGLTDPVGSFAPVASTDELGGAEGSDLVIRCSTVIRANAGAASLYEDNNTTSVVIGRGGITTTFPGTTDATILDGAFSGASVAVTGTVDGRDVSVDGTKLDGIATGATAAVETLQATTDAGATTTTAVSMTGANTFGANGVTNTFTGSVTDFTILDGSILQANDANGAGALTWGTGGGKTHNMGRYLELSTTAAGGTGTRIYMDGEVGDVVLASTGELQFSATTDASATADVFWGRVSAGVSRLGATTNTADGTLHLANINASGITTTFPGTTDATILDGAFSGASVAVTGTVDAGHILATEAAAPGTPATGKVALYAATDGRLYSKDDTGLSSLVSGGVSKISNGAAIIATDTAEAGERMLYDPTAGTFQIDAPASPVMGTRWATKNRSADLTSITISGNGSNIEDPTSSFTLAANFSLSGDGISVEWEYDGTQWVVV